MVALSSVSAALIAFGAVLTSVSAAAGSVVAGLGALFELFLFVSVVTSAARRGPINCCTSSARSAEALVRAFRT